MAAQADGQLVDGGRLGQPQRTLLAEPSAENGADADAASAYRFSVDDTFFAGLYTLGLRSRSGNLQWRQLAVGRAPEESDLRQVSATELEALYPDVDLSVVTSAESFTPESGGRLEIADLLLWLFAAFLLLEGVLAWRFAHHGRAGRGAA